MPETFVLEVCYDKAAACDGSGNCGCAGESGLSLAQQSGSHMIYKNSAGKRATVPFHAAKIPHPKVLRNILRDAGISTDELQKLL